MTQGTSDPTLVGDTAVIAPSVPRRWAIVMGLYLMGIFMGAIDTGIITPARTIVQTDLGVDDQLGIWMITIYTLGYAASIPVMGKMADRIGRKKVYLVSIGLFAVGSLLCGLSQDVGSFEMLIAARAIQAVGGGGILPIATAEIGTEVPEEKRGMALGLVGAVYGIANIFGASAGSLILDIAGPHNWQWIFYVNLPIAAVILVAGFVFLPDHRAGEVKPVDALGTLLLVTMILSLLYGLRNLDFFDLPASLTGTDVYPFLLGFLLLLPLFVLAERRAADPILNLGYFTDRGIALVLLLSLLSGFILMGVIFVPQFAENALEIPTGDGGYFVVILGLASGVGAPLSGRLTDAYGPKAVLGLGAAVSAVAAAVVVWWVIPGPTLLNVVVALLLIGLGLGFVIGSPLNYMMLERTPKAESSSALGTLSLVRSLGTTIAPAILVGLLANAGASVQDSIVSELPTQVTVPALPHASVLKSRIEAWKQDPDLADRLGDVDLSDLDRTTVDIALGEGDSELPDDLVELLSTADVTTITERTKIVAERMFAEQTPSVVADIQGGVQKGIDGLKSAVTEIEGAGVEMDDGLAEMDLAIVGMDDGLEEMDANLADMRRGLAEMDANLADMGTGLTEMDANLADMGTGLTEMDAGITGVAAGIAGLEEAVSGMDEGLAGIDEGLAGMETGLTEQAAALGAIQAQLDQLSQLDPATPPVPELQAQADALAAAIAELEGQRDTALAERDTLAAQAEEAATELGTLQTQRDELIAARDELATGRTELTKARAELATGRTELTKARAELATGRTELTKARAELATGRSELLAAREELLGARAEIADTHAELVDTAAKMVELRDAVPGAFDQALADYLAEIGARAPKIERAFQTGLNSGFRDLYLLYGAACLAVLGVLALVPKPKVRDRDPGPAPDPALDPEQEPRVATPQA